jgi:ATP-dependent Clp protease ATP-binding subunit ClpA
MSRPGIGFAPQDHATDGMEAIRRMFSPEFRNRLDAVIQFQPLERRIIERVVDNRASLGASRVSGSTSV